MRVFFVSSSASGLSWSTELFQLSEHTQVRPLVGVEVTASKLASVANGERANVLHFVDHGDETGIKLANGTKLDPDTIVSVARMLRVDLVFFSACESAALAQYLVDNGVPAVISYTTEVFDADALRIASYFYEELNEHDNDFRLAYKAASPRNGTFAWFSDGRFIDSLVAPLLDKIAQLEKAIQALREAFAANQRKFMAVLLSALFLIIFVNAAALYLTTATRAGAQGTIPQPTPERTIGLTPPVEEPTAEATRTKNPNAATPIKPTRKPTKTPKPKNTKEHKATATATDSTGGGTITLPTETATEESTAEPTASPTVKQEKPTAVQTRIAATLIPINTALPTEKPGETDEPSNPTKPAATETPRSTSTRLATATETVRPTRVSTSTPEPTSTRRPTATATPRRPTPTITPVSLEDMIIIQRYLKSINCTCGE